MSSVAISQLTHTFVTFVERELRLVASVERIETVVRDALFSSRQLWDALNMGLVTEREVAEALTGYLQTSLCEERENTIGDAYERKWIHLIDETEQIILRNRRPA
jgi:hypothetical protein